jgi:TonB family protein
MCCKLQNYKILIVMNNIFFRLTICLFVFVFGLQSEVAAQGQGREKTAGPATSASHPVCLYCPQPSFPREARKAKIESGTVLLKITVSEKGRPTDIEVLTDPGHGFAREALAAVKSWKFKPALSSDGRKVSTRLQIEVVSHLM